MAKVKKKVAAKNSVKKKAAPKKAVVKKKVREPGQGALVARLFSPASSA